MKYVPPLAGAEKEGTTRVPKKNKRVLTFFLSMRIVIICSGSQGDVQPCLALALGLIKRGHSIVMVCNRRYKHLVSSYGVRWSQLSGDPQALLSSPEGQKWLANGDVAKFFSMMTDMLKQNWDNIVQDLDAACSTAECIITTQLGVSAAYW